MSTVASRLSTAAGIAALSGGLVPALQPTAFAPARADLGVLLTNPQQFRAHHWDRFVIVVSNTGTVKAPHAIRVTLRLPRGLTVVQAGLGTFWQCHKQPHLASCGRAATLAANAATIITVTVRSTVRRGTALTATAAVSPPDATPFDNTSSDTAVIH